MKFFFLLTYLLRGKLISIYGVTSSVAATQGFELPIRIPSTVPSEFFSDETDISLEGIKPFSRPSAAAHWYDVA